MGQQTPDHPDEGEQVMAPEYITVEEQFNKWVQFLHGHKQTPELTQAAHLTEITTLTGIQYSLDELVQKLADIELALIKQTEAIRDNTLFHAHDVPTPHKADLTIPTIQPEAPEQTEAPAPTEEEPDAWVVLAAKQYQELKKNK
jgi:hypothetical protein